MTSAEVVAWELQLCGWGTVGAIAALAIAALALWPWRAWPR